jgi:DNA-binding MarR family transcriptional regulator
LADRPEGEVPDPLRVLITGLDLVLRAEEGMTLPCLRTFLAVCDAAEREGRGITVLRLARSVGAYGTRRTNVTRYLKFLRERELLGIEKDSKDPRYDYNVPTARGWDLYDSLRQWPRTATTEATPATGQADDRAQD